MSAPPVPPPRDEAPTLVDYGRVLWRRRAVVGVAAGLVLLLAVVATFVQTPRYRATTTLIVEPDTPEVASFTGATAGSLSQEFYETQYEILRSNRVLSRAFELGGLAKDPVYSGLSNPVAAFRKTIRIAPVPRSRLIRVSVDHPDRDTAIRLCDLVAKVYIDDNAEHRRSASRNAFEWLSSEIEQQKRKLEASEKALLEYRTQDDAISVERKAALVEERLASLSTEYNQVTRKNLELRSTLAELERIGRRADLADASPEILASPVVQSLKEEQSQLSAELAKVSKKYKEKHPTVVALENQLATVRARIAAEVKKVNRGLEVELRIGEAKEKGLRESLDGLKAESMAVAEQSIRYGVLRRENESNQKIFDVLLQRLGEAGVSGSISGQNVRVLDPAAASPGPFSPRKVLNGLVGLLAGLLVGVAAAVIAEQVDNTVSGEKDAAALLGLPVIGTVPTEKGLVDLVGGPPEALRRAYRALRSELALYRREHVLRSLVVTSSLRAEGKTVSTASLGLAWAGSGVRVLVVDTDLFRPSLARTLGVSADVGLSDWLYRGASFDDVVRETAAPGLSVIAAGLIPPHPGEHFGSERMRELVAAARERFDLVLFDAPPLTATLDVALLAAAADGVLFVVRAGATPHPLARKIVGQLRGARANVVGLLVTHAAGEMAGQDYYGDYGQPAKD